MKSILDYFSVEDRDLKSLQTVVEETRNASLQWHRPVLTFRGFPYVPDTEE